MCLGDVAVEVAGPQVLTKEKNAGVDQVQTVQKVDCLGDVVFIQIENFRSESKRDKMECLAKRRVELVPLGTQIHSWLDNRPSAATLSFLPPARSTLHNTTSVDVETFKLRSCLKHTHNHLDKVCWEMSIPTDGSLVGDDADDGDASTAASQSEKQRVRFWSDMSAGASSIDDDDDDDDDDRSQKSAGALPSFRCVTQGVAKNGSLKAVDYRMTPNGDKYPTLKNGSQSSVLPDGTQQSLNRPRNGDVVQALELSLCGDWIRDAQGWLPIQIGSTVLFQEVQARMDADARNMKSLPVGDEVFYVNRDECGIAIYEHAPMDPKYWKYDMANSEYGREFLEELPKLEFQSQCKQQLMASCPASLERYMEEEQELDKALRRAGVKEYLLEKSNEVATGVIANKQL